MGFFCLIFQVLFLDHPSHKVRDTSCYKPFRMLAGGRTPGLKKLSAKVLGVEVQIGEHSSVSRIFVFSYLHRHKFHLLLRYK